MIRTLSANQIALDHAERCSAVARSWPAPWRSPIRAFVSDSVRAGRIDMIVSGFSMALTRPCSATASPR